MRWKRYLPVKQLQRTVGLEFRLRSVQVTFQAQRIALRPQPCFQGEMGVVAQGAVLFDRLVNEFLCNSFSVASGAQNANVCR
jgi:hypothetical protein